MPKLTVTITAPRQDTDYYAQALMLLASRLRCQPCGELPAKVEMVIPGGGGGKIKAEVERDAD